MYIHSYLFVKLIHMQFPYLSTFIHMSYLYFYSSSRIHLLQFKSSPACKVLAQLHLNLLWQQPRFLQEICLQRTSQARLQGLYLGMVVVDG